VTEKIQCACCPVCQKAPTMIVGYKQAFCGNTDCPALTWDPTKTRNENLDDVNFIKPPDGLS
jgi:hypothetical protein